MSVSPVIFAAISALVKLTTSSNCRFPDCRCLQSPGTSVPSKGFKVNSTLSEQPHETNIHSALKVQTMAMLTDTSYNSPNTVLLTIYLNFMECAMKFYRYCKLLKHTQRPKSPLLIRKYDPFSMRRSSFQRKGNREHAKTTFVASDTNRINDRHHSRYSKSRIHSDQEQEQEMRFADLSMRRQETRNSVVSRVSMT